ncbi:coiled-coil domain-containing protein 113-like [Myxocyprinus asiaticus]|uniref:coiled-coil domain-containing protein 113-like n=1 Tax=Myxocyprinus asiaticus TaxID=70543 RepID=UPI002221ECFF|nr:coiled-coil domain-containing protein 113-like [Myxocyprinus asiaticus]
MAETDSKTDADSKQTVELGEDLKRYNALLQAEIDMFERYISRMDPQTGSETSASQEMGTSRGRKSRVRTPERPQMLTLEQKFDVAQSVHKQLIQDLKRLQHRSERALDNYKATLEEADIHLAEVKKESLNFDFDIGKALWDKTNVTMSAEKVIRYTEDRIRAKDSQIEKLHRKNVALLALKRKLQLQLKQQEEMAEGLTALDFEHLKIENIKSRKRMDEQNHEHLKLKLLAGKTLQTLNSKKEKLHTLTNESDALSSDIASRMKLLVKIEEETKQAEGECSKAEALNSKLRGQLADFRVPHVLEYIKVKDCHSQLENNVKAWERKVEIAEMALKTYTKAWDKLRIAAGAGPACARQAALDVELCGL